MIRVAIPGFTHLPLNHLVLPFIGTIAVDGRPLGGVRQRLAGLAQHLTIHVLADAADAQACTLSEHMPCRIVRLPPLNQAIAKRDYVQHLGVDHTVVIGYGRSDALMLEAAALGLAVFSAAGLTREAVQHADLVIRHTVDALGLMLWPNRLVESLEVLE